MAGFTLCASEALSYELEHVAPNDAFTARGRLFERDTESPELALVTSATLAPKVKPGIGLKLFDKRSQSPLNQITVKKN